VHPAIPNDIATIKRNAYSPPSGPRAELDLPRRSRRDPIRAKAVLDSGTQATEFEAECGAKKPAGWLLMRMLYASLFGEFEVIRQNFWT
jgi:hypothetical protein